MKRLVLLILTITCIQAHATKIVGLVPVRNEELLIEQCLRGLACYTDAIVVLDDASEDRTLEIVKSLVDECAIETIIHKETWNRAESDDRNRLLEEGRKIGGTHFVVLDADELFTATCMHNNILRRRILELQPGDSLFMHWICLWKRIDIFRSSNAELKRFIFCDNGIASYPPRYIHSYRVPDNLNETTHDFGNYYTYGVLHFQAVNWRNMRIRQAWYQCLERITRPYVDPKKIVRFYDKPISEQEQYFSASPSEWFAYDFFNPAVYYQADTWREQQIESWVQAYGIDFFKDLSIWDIDWKFETPERSI